MKIRSSQNNSQNDSRSDVALHPVLRAAPDSLAATIGLLRLRTHSGRAARLGVANDAGDRREAPPQTALDAVDQVMHRADR